MLADASILRNFAVVNWIDILIQLAGGTVYVAHGVMSLDPDEPSEIDNIRASFDDESLRHPGSPESTAATAALVGLDDLLARSPREISIITPTAEDIALALRLQDPTEREWRQSLGVRARRLDAGESVSIAISTSRRHPFATDDDDGRAAYVALGGGDHYWTLDLMRRAVEQGLADEPTARSVYADLRNKYRFWGCPLGLAADLNSRRPSLAQAFHRPLASTQATEALLLPDRGHRHSGRILDRFEQLTRSGAGLVRHCRGSTDSSTGF